MRERLSAVPSANPAEGGLDVDDARMGVHIALGKRRSTIVATPRALVWIAPPSVPLLERMLT
jgi:hypothetical protein